MACKMSLKHFSSEMLISAVLCEAALFFNVCQCEKSQFECTLQFYVSNQYTNSVRHRHLRTETSAWQINTVPVQLKRASSSKTRRVSFLAQWKKMYFIYPCHWRQAAGAKELIAMGFLALGITPTVLTASKSCELFKNVLCVFLCAIIKF